MAKYIAIRTCVRCLVRRHHQSMAMLVQLPMLMGGIVGMAIRLNALLERVSTTRKDALVTVVWFHVIPTFVQFRVH